MAGIDFVATECTQADPKTQKGNILEFFIFYLFHQFAISLPSQLITVLNIVKLCTKCYRTISF